MPIVAKCLLCNENLSDSQTLLQYLLHDSLCMMCRRSLKMKKRTIQIEHMKLTSFYEYDDFFSDCLIQYKECMDEALHDVFLSEAKDWIRRHYFHCVFLCAPSSQEALHRRGFQHVRKMFEQCGIPIIECFEKTENVSQKTGTKDKRKEIVQSLILHEKQIPEEKRLVLIDDVATTGSTLMAMQKLVGEKRVQEALCVAIHPKLLSDFDKRRRHKRIYLK